MTCHGQRPIKGHSQVFSNPFRDKTVKRISRLPLFRQPRRATAFTLVEVVIAVGIVSFALLAILGLMSLAVGQIRESEDDGRIMQMIHYTYATAQVELAREEDFLSPPLPWVNGQRILYFNNDGAVVAETDPYIVYRVTAVMGNAPPTQIGNVNFPAKSLRWLNVQVDWPYAAGRTVFRNTTSLPLLFNNAGYK